MKQPVIFSSGVENRKCTHYKTACATHPLAVNSHGIASSAALALGSGDRDQSRQEQNRCIVAVGDWYQVMRIRARYGRNCAIRADLHV